MADNGPLSAAGAARIEDHPELGRLPTAAPIVFTCDGTRIVGREGEPIAAALLAAGVRVFRTMPRFGDSRGGYCLIGRCADCFVVVDGVASVRACVTPVRAGMRVQTQHGLGEAESRIPAEEFAESVE